MDSKVPLDSDYVLIFRESQEVARIWRMSGVGTFGFISQQALTLFPIINGRVAQEGVSFKGTVIIDYSTSRCTYYIYFTCISLIEITNQNA